MVQGAASLASYDHDDTDYSAHTVFGIYFAPGALPDYPVYHGGSFYLSYDQDDVPLKKKRVSNFLEKILNIMYK